MRPTRGLQTARDDVTLAEVTSDLSVRGAHVDAASGRRRQHVERRVVLVLDSTQFVLVSSCLNTV